ncbi:MAG: DUF58 domain-containing protein [Planctomycetota bacterium]
MPRRKRWSFLSPPLEDPTIRWLDDFHRGEFTPGGRAVLWGMLLSGAMLVGGVTEPLAVCFGFCVSALAIGGIVGHLLRPQLKLTRQITSFPSAGEVFRYQVDVENLGKRVARHVVVQERRLPADLRPHGNLPIIDRLEPGEKKSVNLELRCLSRNFFDLENLQAATTFPSGLVNSGRKSRTADRLIVYPRITKIIDFDVPHSRNHQPGGIAIASHVGDSSEFLGTRDWRQGDRLRDIHWPSSARAGRLITREFQEEYFVRLAVVLDIEARKAKDELRLERAISMTAGMTDALAQKEYIVDIFAAGDDIHHFQAGRAIAHLDNILELLACVEAGGELNVRQLEETLVSEARRLSAVIMIVMDWDERRRRLVNRLKNEGLAVRVVCMKSNQSLDGLEEHEIVEVPA